MGQGLKALVLGAWLVDTNCFKGAGFSALYSIKETITNMIKYPQKRKEEQNLYYAKK